MRNKIIQLTCNIMSKRHAILCQNVTQYYVKTSRNIMSKRHGIFTENFTIFFSKAGKTGSVPEFEFDIF